MADLRKWFFDCLGPDNDYVFVYFASVRVAGLTFRTVTVHVARPKKGVVLTRALRIPAWAQEFGSTNGYILRMAEGEIKCLAGGLALSFDAPDVSLRLDYTDLNPCEFEPVRIPAGRKGFVSWKPVGLAYRVSGGVRIGEERLEVQTADGYVDYLEACCWPRAIPVRHLRWGRLIHPRAAITYMHAQDQCGHHAWSRIFSRAGEVTFRSEDVAITALGDEPGLGLFASCGSEYRVSAVKNGGRIALDVRHEMPVQQGGFVDQQQGMSAVTRRLLKFLTRNPQSLKSLCRGDVSLDLPNLRFAQRDIPCVDESVTF